MIPFSNVRPHMMFVGLQDHLRREIMDLNNDYILRASATELEAHFIEKGCRTALQLHVDAVAIEDRGHTRVDVSGDFNRVHIHKDRPMHVPGTKVTIAVPFEGDQELWSVQPSTYGLSGYPDIEILPDRIRFSATFPDDTADGAALKARVERDLSTLQFAVTNLLADVELHNAAIRRLVPETLAIKRERALAAMNAVESLGFPLRRADQAPTFAIPIQRRPAPIRLPTAAHGTYAADPTLDEQEYTYILSILRSLSMVIERNPASFAKLDEEAIRDHFLLHLNGHYTGGATGETFNVSGKTDILVRSGDRNVFIAECKFWRGPKSFDEAITQLLGYLTWRDSKVALVIFNRNRDSESVRLKMQEIMAARPEVKKGPMELSGCDPRYVLVKPDEPGREIHLTTQLYDVPTS